MADITSAIMQLRGQGLTDAIIIEELSKQGYSPDEVHMALSGLEQQNSGFDGGMAQQMAPAFQSAPMQSSSDQNGMYNRIEEITEGIVDEKWDELIKEVKKIVEWKARLEDTQRRLQNDVEKLKEDFKTLHSGVLGKLETYDKRMGDVGTELQAVGKVFKDVIPTFVENVKELGHLTGKVKKK